VIPAAFDYEVADSAGDALALLADYDDFFAGPFESVLSPDELLSAVRVPRGGSVPWGYQKFVRRANDWAIVGVAAALEGKTG
jgi:CO/xanthine dehydrogenase FAD-binding subunit